MLQKGRRKRLPHGLLDIFGTLLTVPFTSEGFFQTALFTRLQVVGVTLDLFDDVLLLYFALEAAQRTLQGFTVLDIDFSQTLIHPLSLYVWWFEIG